MTDNKSTQTELRAIFAAAVKRMNILAVDAPRLFGVTRQTFSNWLNEKTKVPQWVFPRLVQIENEDYSLQIAIERRRAEIADRVRQMKLKH